MHSSFSSVSTINQAIAVVIASVFRSIMAMDELTAFQQSSTCAKLRAVVEEHQNDSAAAVVSVEETILKICEEEGYAYERVFQVRYR